MIKWLTDSPVRMQFVRYLLVGAWNTGFGYGIFCLLTALLMARLPFPYNQWAIILLSNLICVSIAYLLHKYLVFQTRGNILVEYLRFWTVYLPTILANLLALPLITKYLHWNIYLTQGLFMLLVIVASFLGHRYFSFRPSHPTPRHGDEQPV